MLDVCIIGVGNLGGALALALANAGCDIRELIVRDTRIAKRLQKSFLPDVSVLRTSDLKDLASQIVLITTDDPEIPNVVRRIADLVSPGQNIFHTSGSLPSTVLSELTLRGASIGSIHPLTSISDPFAAGTPFHGTYFCVEGDAGALKVGKQLVRAVGGKPFSIDADQKPLYHAAAVVAAGHVATLFDSAVQMMTACGPDRKTARKILQPLIESAVSNLARQDPQNALTGPFARLDIATFQRHIGSFQNSISRELACLYLELGMRSLDLVESRDGKSTKLSEFRKAISIAKQKCR